MKPYKLMCSLHGHTGDVKSLCSTKEEGGFASVSRDLTAKVWQSSRDENGQIQYHQEHTISMHTKFVNAVVVVYGLREFPGGVIVTGSNDQTIAIHDAETKELLCQLKEHTGAVCTLFYDHSAVGNGFLYSGSFDCSVKIWNLNDLKSRDFKVSSVQTVKGHDHTVWSVLAIESKNVLLTASADKLIKQWRLNDARTSAELVGKYAGHTDCVRGLALVTERSDQEFLSCSNDGNALLWRLGQYAPLKQINITDSFLYSVNIVDKSRCLGFDPQGATDKDVCLFMTSGEDRSLRINNLVFDGSRAISSCLQTIALPAQSIWYCLCLNNGNLAVACSDGSIRVFTQNEKQMATKQEMEEYERELAQFTIPIKSNQALSQINRMDLPTIEALSVPGRKDGQTLMVNNENEIEVYQWDSAESRWVKIGVAVGSSEGGASGGKKVNYLGKDYDYVFDIELDDHGQKLKLPYNLSEDPYHAAQKFIHKHELDQVFLDQIAQFIINNTQSQTIGTASTASSYYDPFTGGNRYVPPSGQASTGSESARGGYDPFTGSNAYRSGQDATPERPSSKKSRENNSFSNEFFPHLEYLAFDQVNQIEQILKKLQEFHLKAGQEAKLSPVLANESTFELVKDLVQNWDKFDEVRGDQLDLLFDLLAAWPTDLAFPLIDCVRVLVLNRNVVKHMIQNNKTVELNADMRLASKNSYLSILYRTIESDPTNLNNKLVFFRLLSNLFRAVGRLDELGVSVAQLLSAEADSVLRSVFSSIVEANPDKLKANKGLQTALTTILLNYSILAYNLDTNDAAKVVSHGPAIKESLLELLNNPSVTDLLVQFDSEAVFRSLVALGNLLTSPGVAQGNLSKYDVIRALVNTVITKSDSFLEKVVKCDNYLFNILN